MRLILSSDSRKFFLSRLAEGFQIFDSRWAKYKLSILDKKLSEKISKPVSDIKSVESIYKRFSYLKTIQNCC